MLMTKKDTLRHHQLQIEFPGQEKYWLDNNVKMSQAELEFCLDGMWRSYAKERGWHYTRKHEGSEQFPIEKHWVWYEPL